MNTEQDDKQIVQSQDNEFKQVVLFDNTNLSDVFKKIYQRNVDTTNDISSIVNQMRALINSVSDIQRIIPSVAELLSTSVRNDENLIKLGTMAQKGMITDKGKQSSFSDSALSQRQKQNITQNFLKNQQITEQQIERIRKRYTQNTVVDLQKDQ